MARPRTTRTGRSTTQDKELEWGSFSDLADPSDPDAGGRGSRRSTRTRQEAAKDWIRSHEEAALILAFAFGVIVGLIMED